MTWKETETDPECSIPTSPRPDEDRSEEQRREYVSLWNDLGPERQLELIAEMRVKADLFKSAFVSVARQLKACKEKNFLLESNFQHLEEEKTQP